MEDTDYCSDPKDVRIFSGVVEALLVFESARIQNNHHPQTKAGLGADYSRSINIVRLNRR